MNGTGTGVYSGTLQNLTPLTTYYVRAYATNSLGTSYGNEVVFTSDSLPGVRCPGTPTVTDIDGNIYNTVQIGNQCWTQSNLKVSKYRNGDNIPRGIFPANGNYHTIGTFTWYNNDSLNKSIYGNLYNHHSVSDSRGLCPTGWRVPTFVDWDSLTFSVDSNGFTPWRDLRGINAGGNLKSIATLPVIGGWQNPNSGANDLYGFNGKPSGWVFYAGTFHNLNEESFWWSSSLTFPHTTHADAVKVSYSTSGLFGHSEIRTSGFSVRCIKN